MNMVYATSVFKLILMIVILLSVLFVMFSTLGVGSITIIFSIFYIIIAITIGYGIIDKLKINKTLELAVNEYIYNLDSYFIEEKYIQHLDKTSIHKYDLEESNLVVECYYGILIYFDLVENPIMFVKGLNDYEENVEKIKMHLDEKIIVNL